MRYLIILIALLFSGCNSNNEEIVREKLNIKLADDLSAIIADVDTTHLLETPEFKLVTLEHFKKSKYSYNAVVEFYFLRDNSFRIDRKFRFNADSNKWERYFNEYKKIKE